MSQGLVERQNLEDIADAIRSKNGSSDTYTPAEMAQAISGIHTADEVVLVQKTVNANGQYNASDDSADGYSGVNVNVPNTYSASDEGKVVSNGDLVAQTTKQITANGTHDTTTNNSVSVDVPNSYAAADEGKVVSGGALEGQTSRNVTLNGTYDTTKNNEVIVNVSDGGSSNILYGNDDPISNYGSNGDIYLKYNALHDFTTEYKELSYIEATGTQYIDTGVPCDTSNIAVEMLYMPTDGYTSDNCVFNGQWATNGFLLSLDMNKWKMHDGNVVNKYESYISEEWNSIKVVHNSEATFNGVYHAISNAGTNTNASLKLLGGIQKYGRGKLKSCKVYSGNTIIRNLFPALRISDNAIGMYDIENNTFYQNAGTGVFVPGEDAIQDITDVYCKVNGVWQNLIGTNINDINL